MYFCELTERCNSMNNWQYNWTPNGQCRYTNRSAILCNSTYSTLFNRYILPLKILQDIVTDLVSCQPPIGCGTRGARGAYAPLCLRRETQTRFVANNDPQTVIVFVPPVYAPTAPRLRLYGSHIRDMSGTFSAFTFIVSLISFRL